MLKLTAKILSAYIQEDQLWYFKTLNQCQRRLNEQNRLPPYQFFRHGYSKPQKPDNRLLALTHQNSNKPLLANLHFRPIQNVLDRIDQLLRTRFNVRLTPNAPVQSQWK